MGYIEDMRNLVGNQPLILIGSHAIIVNENNEILLQLRTDFNRWGIIGGALEYNETLEDALKREVYEETGLIIKNQNYSVHTQDQISFKSIQMAIKYTVYSLFIFAANFTVSLYVIKQNQKNYVSFRLMNYLVLFIQLLRGFFAIFITPIKDKNKTASSPVMIMRNEVVHVRSLSQSDFLQDHLLHFHSNHPL